MRVVIDDNSGFCFGVVRAITYAEESLDESNEVYSLGDIVHNRVEVQRLQELGLHTVTHSDMPDLRGKRLFIRAHGEPPSTYLAAKSLGISIVDATCPVVATLQKRVKQVYEKMQSVGGQVVLLGKRGHAEVVGLTGQVNDDVIVIEREEDLSLVDFSRPIYLLSQTTQSISLFQELAQKMEQRLTSGATLEVHDTICRQVANRESHLEEFSRSFEVILFVAGRKSSNGKVLSEVCRAANPRTYLVEEADEVQREWLNGVKSVGVCGATSTPRWLMQRVADRVIALDK
ncbi:MAG: 4-hydroxy-3-methylbut-2-enyl diphosphate reductase [Alistipes sp.]|nr:4-hydroxy-3-methylbut-2-enyl diphosphate reductase [Alistipes sp.]